MYLGSKRMKKEETKKCLEMCLLAKHIFYSVGIVIIEGYGHKVITVRP